MLSRSRAFPILLAIAFLLTPFSLLVGPVSVAGPVEAVDLGAIPVASDGYGYDPATATFVDHNGFAYSYLPDGVIKLVLPWGYTTYFSFGMTATYLGVAQKVTALSYTWTWDAEATEARNETGVLEGYDYTFTATNSATLRWTIQLEFFADGRNMKVTHTLKNGYPNALVGAEFWFLFDLTHTPVPSVTTNAGTFYPPLYSALPSTITWARLSNQFQFDWRDAGWPNGHAYLGSGSVVGLSIQILGIGLMIGDIPSGTTVTVDPYFSGVTRTWAATGNSYSGIAANWSPVGVPATGDNITFDATSTYNCNWNTSVTLGNFLMNTGYSGSVTASSSFGCHNATLTQGTLVGTASRIITVLGDWRQASSGHTFTPSTSTVKFTGIGQEIQTSGSYTTGRFYRAIIDGYLYLDTQAYFTTAGGASWINGTLNVRGYNAYVYVYSSSTISWLSGTGTITGYTSTAGRLYFQCAQSIGATASIRFSESISLNVNIYFASAAVGGPKAYLFSNLTTTRDIIFAGETSNTLTIDFRNKLVSCAYFNSSASAAQLVYVSSSTTSTKISKSVVVSGAGFRFTQNGTLSIAEQLTLTAGIHSFNYPVSVGGNLDSSRSTTTWGASTVYLTGAAKTVKTAPGESFNDLVVGGSYSSTSSVNVTHGLQVNASSSLTIGAGKTATLTDADLTNLGSIIGTGSCVVGTSIDRTISPGTITTAPTTFNLLASATAGRTLTLGGDMSIGALLTVDSLAIYALAFDLDDNDLTTTTGSDLVLTSDAYLLSGGGTVTVADDMTLGAAWQADGTTVSVTDILSLESAVLTDSDISCGDLTASATLLTTNGSIATTDDLTASGTMTASGTDYAVGDDCALSGTVSVTGGDFSVDGDLNVTGSTTLNPDTLGLWALRVLGAGDLSVTTLSLETTEDLYVGPAASLTILDDPMTVGGNWTVLGTWARGNAVVVLTGTGDLEMDSDMSFWNITVALTATITMDNDTYVDLRATVLGSLLGTGDFIEPEPVFTSSPTLDAVPLEVYNYTISQGYWDTLTLVDAPSWLALYGSELKGVPTEADAGPVNVSLLLTWNDMTTYQNYTLWVSYPVVSDSTTLILEIVMALILGMGFMVLGFWQKKSPWTFFAGLIWIFAALAVFSQLGAGWTMLSLGLGFVLLIDGGRKIAEQE